MRKYMERLGEYLTQGTTCARLFALVGAVLFCEGLMAQVVVRWGQTNLFAFGLAISCIGCFLLPVALVGGIRGLLVPLVHYLHDPTIMRLKYKSTGEALREAPYLIVYVGAYGIFCWASIKIVFLPLA